MTLPLWYPTSTSVTMQKRHPLPAARDISTQDRLLDFVLAPRAWNFHPDFTAPPTTSQPEQ
jgi:hypothetical protein